MAQNRGARLHRWVKYDGENGAAVEAEIPGASIVSGGTGDSDLTLDIGGGQHLIAPDRNIVWTEYPGTPTIVQVLDAGLTDEQVEQIYGLLCDCSALEELLGQSVQAAQGTTDANGSVTITWPEVFAAAPTVSLAIQTSTAEVHSARITALTATSVTVHVARSPVVAVLGVNVTAAMVNASGVVVHAVAVGTI